MFSEMCFKELEKRGYIRKYARNCYIGFSCAYVIASLCALFCIARFFSYPKAVMLVIMIIDIIGLLVINIVTNCNIMKAEPHLCCLAEVTEVSKNTAIIKIGDRTVKGESFERFLNNESLNEYKSGDKVIVYSPGKSMKRPLFTKAENNR